MPRIAIPSRDDAPEAAKPILDAVHAQLGFVPNLHRLMALSPNVLAGFVGLQGPLAKTLDIKTRDAIALAVSQADGCDYCLAGHSYLAATFSKVSLEEIALNRKGASADAKRAAAAHFAQALIEARGKVADADLAAVREAGFSDPQIVEIVALSAQFLLANFLNNVADTDIDFPALEATRAA
ncbi:peroxidase-related enzyme [Aquabacter sp. CN5-332]|uniref:carboxymuconolactone decarboxylase family protein n=1 Tax=Aquabacter sp. CN5-332 TaxID=3156608 RepID=UPI0032B5C53A